MPGGKITGDQGDRHRGVDIFAPVGTPVKSPFSGTLLQAKQGGTINASEDSNPAKSGFQPQHSIVIKLDTPILINGKTITHAYLTHLTELEANLSNSIGKRIEAGQKLGTVGVAGGAAHLHLGLSETRQFRGNAPLSNSDTLALLTSLAVNPNSPSKSPARNAKVSGGNLPHGTFRVSIPNTQNPQALLRFARSLFPNPNQFTKGESLAQLGSIFGINPVDLASLISFESAGSFNPQKRGGAGGIYKGLIQFGPPEQRAFKELDARNLIRQFPTNQNVPNNNGIHLLAFMLVSLVILVGGIVLVKSSKVESHATPAATAAPSVPVVPSSLGISPQ